MQDQSFSAAEALAAAEASRAKMASVADCPPSRHWAFALLFGGVVAVQAASMPWNLVGDGLIVAAVAITVAMDRARKGVFVNGYRAGKTRPLTLGLIVFMLAIYAPAYWLRMKHGAIWAPLAGGALVAVVAYFASRRWSQVYRAEMEARL